MRNGAAGSMLQRVQYMELRSRVVQVIIPLHLAKIWLQKLRGSADLARLDSYTSGLRVLSALYSYASVCLEVVE